MYTYAETPLAERMRPKVLSEFVGQQHLTGANGAITRLLQSGILPSMILWGPPGVGKTTLANLLAKAFSRDFFTLNAIHSGVKDVRDIIDKSKQSGFMGEFKKPVLFIDEIHRFNKSQQDSLLNAAEKGIVCLIGATTENPSFEVIQALLSRCQIFVMQSMSKEELQEVLTRALENDEWLKSKHIVIEEPDALIAMSGGDARKMLNYLEIIAGSKQETNQPLVINNTTTASLLQRSLPAYDKNGEMHYDIISAFIKSLRSSDPNAALYWMARMLEGGEDPRFIARRMLILASEDIGNANPNALLLAESCFSSVSIIGMPEARIILSQTAVYLASSPKSNASYLAIDNAIQTVRDTGNLPVPLHLRNAPTKLMKTLNYGVGYKYDHDYEAHFSAQECMPDALIGKQFYQPGDNPRENELRELLKKRWKDKYGF